MQRPGYVHQHARNSPILVVWCPNSHSGEVIDADGSPVGVEIRVGTKIEVVGLVVVPISAQLPSIKSQKVIKARHILL